MRRIPCVLGLACLLAGGPGCFVLEELDSGMEKMKASSPGGSPGRTGTQEEAASADEAPTRRSPRKAIDLAAWWKSARTPGSGPEDPGAAAEIVTCRIGGEQRFMNRTDCEVQGGRY